MTNGDNDWQVAFYRRARTWYGKLIPGEFKHVALFRYNTETNTWTYLDYDFRGVHCFVMPGTEDGIAPLAGALSGGSCAIVRFSVTDREFVPRGISTCVNFVKHALGIRRPFIVTPDQLYWWLLDSGAEHIKS